MQSSAVINVTVTETGISVDPDRCRIRRAQSVRWAAVNNEPFRIEFLDESPFEVKVLDFSAATTPSEVTPYAEMREYKYTIVSNRNPTVKLDPIIVIDDPPSGTGKASDG
jgi:hypothetical protein